MAMRQMNFDSKFEEVSRKPQSHISHEDAREMQAIEVWSSLMSAMSAVNNNRVAPLVVIPAEAPCPNKSV